MRSSWQAVKFLLEIIALQICVLGVALSLAMSFF